MTVRSSGRRPVRPARTRDAGEVARLYDICLRTGADRQDAAAPYRDPQLLGEVYLGAYLELEPDLAFVLEDDDGAPLGYVVGTRDTLAFADLLEKRWWPRLRERYPLGSFPAGSRDEELVRLMHHPTLPAAALISAFPAHLHIDVLPVEQGAGNGRRLLETLVGALQHRAVAGVHLGASPTNTRATGFYQHLGFAPLGGDLWGKRL